MECLFQTTAQNTYEEYRRYCMKFFFTKSRIIMYAIAFAYLIFLGIYLENLWVLVFVIMFPFLCWLLYELRIRKIFYSNKVMKNVDITYKFYDTYFENSNEVAQSKIEYVKLYKIIETKKDFYLMISKNQGCVMPKSNFPQGLAEFIREIKVKYSV